MTEPKLPANDLDLVRNGARESLEQLQLERLRQTLEAVYANVPPYRAKFDAAGVCPQDLASLPDLARFPFTTKQDLRDNYPFGLFAVPRDELVRVHASSGTTGKSTVVGYTRSDIEVWTGLMARSLHVAGVRSGDTLHVAFGYGLFTGGLGAHYGAESLGCAVIPVSVGQTARQVQLISDLEPDVIMGTPSYVLTIADEFERQGIDPRDSSLRIGIFGAEPWSEPMRKEIEGRFGIEALDLYGLSEVVGPGVSQEFAESKGAPTVWEDHFYPEVIDPESGAVLPEGEEGELVLTTLTKEALPMIRYRTRDLTRLLPPDVGCMRRMARVAARSDDMLIIRGVNVFPTQIEERVLAQPLLSPYYLLDLYREGHLDRLDVLVEMHPAHASAGESERRSVAEALQHDVKSYVGLATRVRIVEGGEIERSQGKAKHVRDRRSNDP
jgi:phenylacetate-CoA ligase